MTRRTAALIVLAVVLFAATCSYRFLTLGGRLGGLDNDEFVVLSYSQLLVLGDVPIRDYVEPGRPLQHVMLAASEWAFGQTLLPPIALSMAMIGVSTLVLFLLAERASGSIAVAFAIALVQILMAPRYYNYPKVLAYAIGIPVMWWYMSKPGRGRLLGIALAGVIAFLLRHDHGAYMAVAGLAAVVLAHWPDMRRAAREVAVLGLMTLALVGPYVAYTQAYTGLRGYLRSSMEFGERSVGQTALRQFPRFGVDVTAPLLSWMPPPPEPQPHINATWRHGTPEGARTEREQALGMIVDNPVAPDTWNYKLGRWSKPDLQSILDEPLIASIEGINRTTLDTGTRLVSRRGKVLDFFSRVRPLPGILNEDNAIAFFFYVLGLSPLLVLTIALARKDAFEQSRFSGGALKLSVVAILAIVMLIGLLRGNLTARFADVSEPIGVLVAALVGLLIRRRSPNGRLLASGAALCLFIVALWSVQLIENVTLQISETGITSASVLRHARDVYHTLTANPPVTAWDAREPGIVSTAAYVNRCTRPDDRVVVVGYVPELYFLSQRGSGSGGPWVLPGFYERDDDQAFTIAKMRAHRVPIVFTVPDPAYAEDYAPLFQHLDEYLQSNYRQVGVFDRDPRYVLRVLVRRDLVSAGNDPITDLPCFVG